MTSTITPAEIPAPEAPTSIEQGLINNGIDPILVQGIGAMLNQFAERHESAPMSIKAGVDRVRAERAEKALDNANIDYITGLHGPKKFWEDIDSYAKRLNTESPDRRSVAVLLCDLSGLKRINDSGVYGHDEGDKYLREVAAALEKLTRPDDEWYRLGQRADEIAGILHGVKPDKDGSYEENIELILEKLTLGVREHLISVGLPVEELRLGILMAGSMLKPGESTKHLFKRVDAVLRKKRSKSRESLPDNLKHDDRLI